jgi:hypothetical protein
MSKTSLCDLPNPLCQFNRLTVGDLQAVYPLLAAPFPDEAIERTSGSETGRGYNTTGIGYQYIVDRFNAVLGPGHIRTTVNALTVSTTHTAKGETMYQVECDLTLTIGNWVDGQWDVLAESQNYGGHDSLCVVDAKKGARSNAFKKTAAFFGPGHEAYSGILDEDARPAVVSDFPSGEFAIRLNDGSVVQKTSKDGKPYSLFTGIAAPEGNVPGCLHRPPRVVAARAPVPATSDPGIFGTAIVCDRSGGTVNRKRLPGVEIGKIPRPSTAYGCTNRP